MSVGYFGAPELGRWVWQAIAEHDIRRAFVYSSPMMAYLPPRQGLSTILDLVDVDSEKWREMAARAPIPQRWIYAREARTLLAFERNMSASAAHTLLVTEEEMQLFLARAPEAAARTSWMRNGVDIDYFSPAPPAFRGPLPTIARPSSLRATWDIGPMSRR